MIQAKTASPRQTRFSYNEAKARGGFYIRDNHNNIYYKYVLFVPGSQTRMTIDQQGWVDFVDDSDTSGEESTFTPCDEPVLFNRS